MAVALITGASRGLGLQYCKHLLANYPSATVYAACRDPVNATHLQELSAEHDNKRLILTQMDVTQDHHMRSVARDIKEAHGTLDLLINCPAMLHPSGRGETSLRQVESKVGALCTVWCTWLLQQQYWSLTIDFQLTTLVGSGGYFPPQLYRTANCGQEFCTAAQERHMPISA